MPKLDRALYAFAATMILLAAVGHTVFLTPHSEANVQPAPTDLHPPLNAPFEGSLVV